MTKFPHRLVVMEDGEIKEIGTAIIYNTDGETTLSDWVKPKDDSKKIPALPLKSALKIGDSKSILVKNMDANSFGYLNNNANNVSANYCVDEKDIICTIPPGYMSYGVTGHNEHIITIETCFKDPAGRFELDTIANLRRVVKKCIRDFGIPPENVVRHYDLTGKKCPWYYVDNPKEWTRLHRMITKGVVL